MAVLVLVAAFALGVALAVLRMAWTWFVLARRREFGHTLLDLLALAIRRGAPLPGVLSAAGQERTTHERHRLERAADRLADGAPLGATLADWGDGVFGRPVCAALRAGDGSGAEAAVLNACARATADRLSVGHRVLLTLAYPAGVGAFCAFAFSLGQPGFLARWWRQVLDCIDVDAEGARFAISLATSGGWVGAGLATVFLVALLVGWLAARDTTLGRLVARTVERVARFLPVVGAMTRRGERVLALRVYACLVAAGVPRDAAWERCAPIVRRPGELPDGDIERVWQTLGLPATARARASAAFARPVAEAASVLDRLADEATERLRAATDRTLAWLRPAAVVIVGAMIAAQADAAFQVIWAAQEAAKPW